MRYLLLFRDFINLSKYLIYFKRISLLIHLLEGILIIKKVGLSILISKVIIALYN